MGKLLRGAFVGAGTAALAVTLALASPAYARADGAEPAPIARTVSSPWTSPGSTGPAVDAVPATMESKIPLPPADALLDPLELATIRLFQENTPTVVNISNIIAARTPFSMDILKIPQGQGSGFIWDDKGHVVTNYHVIRGAAEVRVTLIDQTVWKAKIVGGDPSKDVAVLQLEAPSGVLKNLKSVVVGESSNLFVGQRVFAIGNPFGLDHSLTQGIVSGVNRELATGMGPALRNVIQTDAAINPGKPKISHSFFNSKLKKN